MEQLIVIQTHTLFKATLIFFKWWLHQKNNKVFVSESELFFALYKTVLLP